MSDTPLTKIQLRVVTFMYLYKGLTIAHQWQPQYDTFWFVDPSTDGDVIDLKPEHVQLYKPLFKSGPGKIITHNLYKKGYLVIDYKTKRFIVYKLNPLVIDALASLIDPKTCCAPGSCPNDPDLIIETTPLDCTSCGHFK